MNPRIFSGMQPTGELHIGNYLGALRNWARIQYEYESIFCIVDQHAITVRQDPKRLRESCEQVAALYLAAGLDPKQSAVFVQSQISAHVELAWIFTCTVPFGWLGRMTQFKAKTRQAGNNRDSVGTGLFIYPVLMAADILLYQAKLVPVGDDQSQHMELTRQHCLPLQQAVRSDLRGAPDQAADCRGPHHGPRRSDQEDEQVGQCPQSLDQHARPAGAREEEDRSRQDRFAARR